MALIDILASDIGSEANYLAASPWAIGANQLSQLQDPVSTRGREITGLEAFMVPFVRNAGTAYLLKRAREDAAQDAYKDVANSPIWSALKAEGYGENVGPVASGEEYGAALADPKTNSVLSALVGKYGQEELPEGFDVKTAKRDMVLAALLRDEEKKKEAAQAELLQEFNKGLLKDYGVMLGADGKPQSIEWLQGLKQEKAKQELANEVAKASALEEAKAKAKTAGAAKVDIDWINKVPEKLQPKAVEEEGFANQLDNGIAQIKEIFKEVENYSLGVALPYTEKAQKFARFVPAFQAIANSATGREASDPSVERMTNFAPKPGDTEAVRKEKERGAIEALKAMKRPTPLRDAILSKQTESPAVFLAGLKAKGVSKAEAEKLYRERYGG